MTECKDWQFMLRDGTGGMIVPLCSCGEMPCRGGQHAGGGRCLVVVLDLVTGGSLRIVSGLDTFSQHRTRIEVMKCASWTEVPLAIEATGVV